MPSRNPTRVYREFEIENWCKAYARDAGWWCRKFVSVAQRSVPDDVFAKGGRIFFVEFKATGKIPTPAQVQEHRAMRDHGVTVYAVNDREDFIRIMVDEENNAKNMQRGVGAIMAFITPLIRETLNLVSEALAEKEDFETVSDQTLKAISLNLDRVDTALEPA